MLHHVVRLAWPIAAAIIALAALIFFGILAATTSLVAALGVAIAVAGLFTLFLGDAKRSIVVVAIGVALVLAHYALPPLTIGTTTTALGWSS